MIISAIVAVDKHNAIGRDNNLPWHLPEDLKFFKRTTMGKPVVMGRKTFESLGKPLPNRLNIVLSRQENITLPEHVLHYQDIDTAIRYLKEQGHDEIFIIGGGKIFTETLPIIEQLYITEVDTVVADADVFFPHIDHSQWKLTWEEPHGSDEKHAFAYTFRKYERASL